MTVSEAASLFLLLDSGRKCPKAGNWWDLRSHTPQKERYHLALGQGGQIFEITIRSVESANQ